MNKLFAIAIGVILLIMLLLFSTTYTVAYHEVAIKTTFGQTGADDDSVIRDPGLKFKLPFFADRVKHLDTRVQLTESPLKTVPTADNQQVVIRAFLLWRVNTEGRGPIDFMRAFSSAKDAEDKLSGQLEAALGAISRFRFEDVVGRDSQLEQIEDAVLAELNKNIALGVKPEMVGISQVLLPSKTTTAVLRRMKADREALAQAERAKGTAEAERIVSEANTKADKIRAFAKQAAESIRSEGYDAAATYYAKMNEDPELAIFLAWLDALEKTLAQYTTVFVETKFAPFHLLDLDSKRTSQGIPMPQEALPGLNPGPSASIDDPTPKNIASGAGS